MGEWWTVLGRLHVATVHFPIALLLVGGLLDLANRSGDAGRERTARTMIAFGALGAVLAAALGWIHAGAEPLGSSVATTLERHRWLGIAAAVLATLAAALGRSRTVRRALVAGAMATVAVAGHLGGELTYGEGWFLEPLSEGASRDVEAGDVPARNPEDAGPRGASLEFTRDVRPVLLERCSDCHGETKQKGDLRLDRIEPRWFETGELGTTVVVRGQPEQSELVRRIELPLDDDDHMPPPKKPQLTAEQIAAIRRWIELGAP